MRFSMNPLGKEKSSAPIPALPPRPSKQESSNTAECGANEESKSKRTGVMGVMQKVNPFKAFSQTTSTVSSLEPGTEPTQNTGMLKGMIQKVNPFKSSAPQNLEQKAKKELGDESVESREKKQNPGVMASVIQKVNPFKPWQSKGAEPVQPPHPESQTDTGNLSGKPQETAADDLRDGADPKSQTNEQPTKRKTFRIKRILPAALFGSGAKESDAPPPQEVEVQTLEMLDLPALEDSSDLDSLEDEGGLLTWWRTVDGWDQWNETVLDYTPEEVVEAAADRVFMAARLFVALFNRRGASLQRRILDLLALADSADHFHKKTLSASVGGSVAGVAGSVTTITGLILAPFTAGTSLIVTAVGVGVATAGGLTSASAGITDTVHSRTDRKKVERMIQGYREEMSDIQDCLEFLQEGMETLEEWNFERYAKSVSQKYANQNVKHVVKEGAQAGKALVINAESLVSTVQVLNVAGGAAKAAQVMSVTTGVMSGLFLALDLYFLAKDSVELKKGAKTEFAAKIREVCKDLQDGLLELNRIKEDLQKTMDGIQVEEDDSEDEED
ncbi:uncharacterized protein LOC144066082 isoform X2 [Stigmatopora argus]